MVDLIPGLGRSLEKEMAAHSSILAREIPWTEEPGRLQSTGSVKHWTQLSDETTYIHTHIHTYICLYTCVYLCTHTHTHTHGHDPLHVNEKSETLPEILVLWTHFWFPMLSKRALCKLMLRISRTAWTPLLPHPSSLTTGYCIMAASPKNTAQAPGHTLQTELLCAGTRVWASTNPWQVLRATLKLQSLPLQPEVNITDTPWEAQWTTEMGESPVSHFP